MKKEMDRIDSLLEKSCYIMDFLPEQVEKNADVLLPCICPMEWVD